MVLRYSGPVIGFALAHCLRDRLTIHEGTSRRMNRRSTTADLNGKLRRLIRSMDFVARHPALKRAGPEAERLAEVYQQLGLAWEFLVLQCHHRSGWRRTRAGRSACKFGESP
jgi:hypothetical protein